MTAPAPDFDAAREDTWEVAHGWNGQEPTINRFNNEAEAHTFADKLFREHYAASSNWKISTYRVERT